MVLVRGGAASIGSELCRQVINFGCKHLIIYDQHENGMFFLNQEFAAKYDTSVYTLVIGTVRERDKLTEVLAEYKPDIIFHAAAYKHVPMMEISATEAIKNNVFGTLNVIECAEKAGVKKFVLISTDKAVNPSNIMGASKRIAEMVIETRGKSMKMKMAAVRFGNVLGSNGSVIPIFYSRFVRAVPLRLPTDTLSVTLCPFPKRSDWCFKRARLPTTARFLCWTWATPFTFTTLRAT